jgi:hypothetical protein
MMWVRYPWRFWSSGWWSHLVSAAQGWLRRDTGEVPAGVAALESGSPYREAAPGSREHPFDCQHCEWLKRVGRYQPPEVVLSGGLPTECLCRHFKMDLGELDDLAVKCGLLRSKGE